MAYFIADGPVIWTPGKKLNAREWGAIHKFFPSLLPVPQGGSPIALGGRTSQDTQNALQAVVVANAQSAVIATTTILPISGFASGIYRVEMVTLITTLQVGAATIAITIGWTDDAQAETNANTTLTLTALGFRSDSIVIHALNTVAITYATNSTGTLALGRYGIGIAVTRVA